MRSRSHAFSSHVETRPAGRGIVLASGGVLGVAGSVPVAQICPGYASLGIWAALVAARLWLLGRRFGSTTGFRLAVGQALEMRDSCGVWHPAEILPGTAVVGGVVWLRYRCGISRAELLFGDAACDPDWRRFLVLMRHRPTGDES